MQEDIDDEANHIIRMSKILVNKMIKSFCDETIRVARLKLNLD